MQVSEIKRSGLEIMCLPYTYLASAWRGGRRHALFDQVERCCIFLGYPASGHSLVGALLDAHPDMVVSHELGLMKYVFARFQRNQLYQLMLDKSDAFARRDRVWGGYSYQVPGQWQGRWRQLRVIGDKKGMSTSLWMGPRPHRLDQLRESIGVPVKVIQAVRNPFDNIATMLRKGQEGATKLDECINTYQRLSGFVKNARTWIGEDDLYDLRHEDFVADPKNHLVALCRFLQVDAPQDYIEACASIVFESPRKTRHGTTWTAEQISRVNDCIARYDHLHGYRFEE